MSILAVAGWTRNPATVSAYNPTAPVATNFASSPAMPTPASQAAYAPAYGSNYPAPAAANCNDGTTGFQNAAYAPADYGSNVESRYRTYSRPRVVRYMDTPHTTSYVEQERSRREVVYEPRHHRSTKKSVAIVAGSASAGAAIGALAGGGKGAGIGALSGGAAGFIYDRLTHNR